MPSSPPPGYDYYFEWIRAIDWANNTAMSHHPDPHYYGLSTFTVDQDKIITINIPYGSQYSLYNRFGDQITGQVYGIKKGFGRWKDNYFLKGAPFGIVDGCYDALTLTFIIDDINNHIHPNDIGPELECNGYAHISDGETPEDPSIDGLCQESYFEVLGGDASSNDGGNTWTVTTVGQIIDLPCYENYNPIEGIAGGSSVSGNAFTWPENISRISLKMIDTDESNETIYLTKEQFFDAENNYIPNNIAFPKGFYIIGYQGVDLSYHAYYFENKEATTFNLNQANFVNYTAYPVPITTDKFNLTVQATQRVSFRYEVKSASGELLFADDYEIEKGKTLEKSIAPVNGIPAGQLFNKLIFKDGSEISFQTVKN